MVDEGVSCLKHLRLVGREFCIRREELRNELSGNLSLEIWGGRERHRWSEERVLSVGLVLMRLRR